MGFWKRTSSRAYNAEKVFCIGLNKTGTTSLGRALKDLGYTVGDQTAGELLQDEYAARNFTPILKFCTTADAFHDAPFSFPFTYILLDHHFPNAKFILSVRDSAAQWYNSLITFHGNLFANGQVPTKEDLQNAMYRRKGFVWETNRILLNTPEDDIYHRPTLLACYERHNSGVRDYFRYKKNFIEINLSEKGTYPKMCAFLGRRPVNDEFPWLNKTEWHA